MNATEETKPHPEDVLVDEITRRVAAYKHHPKFRRAVREAKNLVMHYLDCQEVKVLQPRDKDFIERIACALHSARIERGY